MDQLLEGYRRFRANFWPAAHRRYEMLAEQGQQPHTLVIACSDSRADPATVFDAGPGELFVVRNVAGLVPPYRPDGGLHAASAALEFGVRVLKVDKIVVMGHARCGGVQAMVEGAPEEARDFVLPWMKVAEPALETVPAEAQGAEALYLGEAAVVRLSLANLRTFPWIAEAIDAGRLTTHGYKFDIHTGVLMHVTDDGMIPVE